MKQTMQMEKKSLFSSQDVRRIDSAVLNRRVFIFFRITAHHTAFGNYRIENVAGLATISQMTRVLESGGVRMRSITPADCTRCRQSILSQMAICDGGLWWIRRRIIRVPSCWLFLHRNTICASLCTCIPCKFNFHHIDIDIQGKKMF